ncbi:MAG TPA: hypothetical protein VGX68_28520 [Thermoanaerobaculia bacterium]|jgi:hypothetical protein|nr:hypothetical protein [Thermoanaerobaculia bacterium]
MTQPAPWSAARTIGIGTLIVGTLDILDAIIFFGLRNDVPPIRIFHSIAAGLLGRDAARAGGLPTAYLGAFLHYFIAFSIVTVYYLASRKISFLTRQPWIAGAIYGVLVYLFMNLVVLPLSAIHSSPTLTPSVGLLNGVLIHIFGIGIPSALVARKGTVR